MRQSGDRSRCETETTVHRGNWAEPEAPREEADPRRPRGFTSVTPRMEPMLGKEPTGTLTTKSDPFL